VNFLFRAYKWAHQRQEAQLLDGSPLDAQIHLDHPISRIYGFQVPLSSHFFGVQFWEQNGTNQTSHHPSKMESASYIALWSALASKIASFLHSFIFIRKFLKGINFILFLINNY